mmetsp:Transcript_60278/g.70430  ORF Transcript_60278/g.70430 Transcript_60278/m.70430 type:complete len:110 (-) Transcript_60278:619-948(-)
MYAISTNTSLFPSNRFPKSNKPSYNIETKKQPLASLGMHSLVLHLLKMSVLHIFRVNTMIQSDAARNKSTVTTAENGSPVQLCKTPTDARNNKTQGFFHSKSHPEALRT